MDSGDDSEPLRALDRAAHLSDQVRLVQEEKEYMLHGRNASASQEHKSAMLVHIRIIVVVPKCIHCAWYVNTAKVLNAPWV